MNGIVLNPVETKSSTISSGTQVSFRVSFKDYKTKLTWSWGDVPVKINGQEYLLQKRDFCAVSCQTVEDTKLLMEITNELSGKNRVLVIERTSNYPGFYVLDGEDSKNFASLHNVGKTWRCVFANMIKHIALELGKEVFVVRNQSGKFKTIRVYEDSKPELVRTSRTLNNAIESFLAE